MRQKYPHYRWQKYFVGYDAGLMELTISGFKIFALSFLFMGFAIFSSGFFTALNDGLTSAVILFLRTLVFQVAAVLLLPLIWGIRGVWISIVVAEIMAVVISVIFLVIKRKNINIEEKRGFRVFRQVINFLSYSSLMVAVIGIVQIRLAGARGAKREITTSSASIPPIAEKGICHAVPQ